MKNNMFDPNMLKNIENMMKGFGGFNNQPVFDIAKIKKYIYFAILSVFLSGFGVGIMLGLLF
jgi:hypothetical protein